MSKLRGLTEYEHGILCIVIATFAFSTMEIFGKMAVGLHPFQLTFLRFFIGGILLLPLAVRELRVQHLRLKAGDWVFFGITGVLGITISMCLFQLALQYTKATVVAVIFSSNPLVTAPLAHWFLKEPIRTRNWVALVLSMLGVLLIFNPFSLDPDAKGMLLALASAVLFSLYTVLGKTRIRRYGGLVLNSFSFLIGSGVLLAGLLFAHMPVLSGIGGDNLFPLLYLSLFVTGLGYYCYFTAMKYTSAIAASSVFFIKPALASVLAWLILHERMSGLATVGIAFIILASVLMLWKGRLPFSGKKKPE